LKGNFIQILLVEDEQSHVEVIKLAFISYSNRIEIKIVWSLEETIGFLAKSEPELVIVDFALPDGQGTELLPVANQDM
jgi:response regulator of citrate/malate metabolism